MMINVEKAANAIGGKTARACDGCLRRRARWFCAPDDAFLCQACDSSVHSANQLASRHERIRLQTTSSSSKPMNSSLTSTGDIISPGTAWHRRRARTPRRNSNSKNSWMSGRQHDVEKANRWGNLMEPVVPEMGSEQGSMDEDEFDEQMTCRVPVFDPFEAEFSNNDDQVNQVNCDMKVVDGDDELEGFNEFLPSDLDLAEFAADVESLLGAETEEDSKGIDITSNNNVYHELHNKIDDQKAVMEELPGVRLKTEADFVVSSAMADLEYEDPVITGNGKEAEERKVFPVGTTSTVDDGAETSQVEMKRKRLLKLNYECVIAAWASQGSPWTTGTRPEFKPGACWPDFAACDGGSDYKGVRGRRIDGEREARVSRYREKRRTRLFSKKIRYEVRKLNAEKRPRMKGRFVKRSLFMPMGDFSCFSVY